MKQYFSSIFLSTIFTLFFNFSYFDVWTDVIEDSSSFIKTYKLLEKDEKMRELLQPEFFDILELSFFPIKIFCEFFYSVYSGKKCDFDPSLLIEIKHIFKKKKKFFEMEQKHFHDLKTMEIIERETFL